MSRFHSYLRSAAGFVTAYKGEEPFTSFLKKQFAADKKFGSRDRREINKLCYSFFRLGKSTEGLSLEEQLLTGLFLCSSEPQDLLQELRPKWNSLAGWPLVEKLQLLKGRINPAGFFPFTEPLSDGIEGGLFAQSHLVQPDLFIRIRPEQERQVKQKLNDAGIRYTQPFVSCVALANGTSLEGVLSLNRDAVVQDAASQQLGNLLQLIPAGEPLTTLWDCCAASGGKSILAIDRLPGIGLTVSDVRESIIRNLQVRFREAGINNYHSFIADLSQPWNAKVLQQQKFDLIIADVPCSGSGTWGRTPEYLTHFSPAALDGYQQLQRSIVQQVLPFLRTGGYLLYSTCSVFRKENEEQVDWLQQHYGLEVVRAEPIKGYMFHADTMYGALLKKVK
jgi:16S rRNA (cytosine967-C5)-methyltransferase